MKCRSEVFEPRGVGLALFEPYRETDAEKVEFTAIPYYSYDYSDPDATRVWTRTT